MIARVRGVTRRCCGCWINVERVRSNVHEDGSCPLVRHRCSGGGECVHRHDDLVARTEPKPLKGEVQPGRGRTDRHGFDPTAQEVNEGALEALRLGAGGDPAGAQAVDDLGDFGLAQIGHRERQEIVPGNASFASIERSEFRRAGPPCGLRSDSSIAPVRRTGISTSSVIRCPSAGLCRDLGASSGRFREALRRCLRGEVAKALASSRRKAVESCCPVFPHVSSEWRHVQALTKLCFKRSATDFGVASPIRGVSALSQAGARVRSSRHTVAAPWPGASRPHRLRRWSVATTAESDRRPTGLAAGPGRCH